MEFQASASMKDMQVRLGVRLGKERIKKVRVMSVCKRLDLPV